MEARDGPGCALSTLHASLVGNLISSSAILGGRDYAPSLHTEKRRLRLPEGFAKTNKASRWQCWDSHHGLVKF